jgi:hypothetical protein
MVKLFIFSYQQTKQVFVGKFLQHPVPGFKVVQNITANMAANV